MKNSLLLLTALLTAASFSACNRPAADDDRPESPVYRHDSVHFDAVTCQVSNELTGSAGDFFHDSDLIYTDSISLVIPVCDGTDNLQQLRDSILRMAFDTVSNNIDSLITAFISNDARRFEYPVRRVPDVDILIADGYEFISGSVVNFNPSLLVYEVANSSYSPGTVHGTTTRNYMNYDLEAARMLDGKFMFDPAKRPELAGIIARRAAEMTEIIGPTRIDSLPENDNFYINPEGEIVFVYQPYEVASYAQGLISISFYPAELADCLTADARKYFALDDLD